VVKHEKGNNDRDIRRRRLQLFQRGDGYIVAQAASDGSCCRRGLDPCRPVAEPFKLFEEEARTAAHVKDKRSWRETLPDLENSMPVYGRQAQPGLARPDDVLSPQQAVGKHGHARLGASSPVGLVKQLARRRRQRQRAGDTQSAGGASQEMAPAIQAICFPKIAIANRTGGRPVHCWTEFAHLLIPPADRRGLEGIKISRSMASPTLKERIMLPLAPLDTPMRGQKVTGTSITVRL
jgi:hypothetical protein